MQTGYAPPVVTDNTYPGYCLVYPKALENQGTDLVKSAIAIGSPSTAAYLAPSLFDGIHTFTEPTDICVGHQAGVNLQDKVYLSIYEVNGTPSEYHAVARIAITTLDPGE